MAKLVDVHHGDKEYNLKRRQLPLIIDENLTMIMDLSSMGLTCDSPAVRGKALEAFTKKYNMLTSEELVAALDVSYRDIMNTLSHTVPCVGCRRSVEDLYLQLRLCNYDPFDPLMVHSGGVHVGGYINPQKLCTLLNGYTNRLHAIVEAQPRSKKSLRCSLHSLDSQRMRPACPAWCDVWDCMVDACRDEVVFIEAAVLSSTLENYLHKHRFCSDCRTKVIKAYKMLIEEDRNKEDEVEKGFVPALYANIKCCYEERHIHLPSDTEYIADLIMKAEPELLGSKRERHAKTMEIAQEEVLTCLGICVYERLHRMHLRLKEEECTCQVFVAVAVDTICRSFEMAVEKKQGISRLELLYKQITKEDQAKELRKLNKRLRRRKKKERRNDNPVCEIDNEHEDSQSNISEEKNEADCCCDDINTNCKCDNMKTNSKKQCCKKTKNNSDSLNNLQDVPVLKDTKLSLSHCDHASNTTEKQSSKISDCKLCDNTTQIDKSKVPQHCWSLNEHSHDCGYSSENNNGACDTGSAASSLISSPYGSEIACSDGFCNHERGDCSLAEMQDNEMKITRHVGTGGLVLTLQQMLDTSDEDDDISYIPMEEILEFKSRQNIQEQRLQLRRTLQKRFDQLCLKDPISRHSPSLN